MLIAIAAAAAAAVVSSATPAEAADPAAVQLKERREELETIRLAPCDAGVVRADGAVGYDRKGTDPARLDRQPYRGDVLLFSTVERKVGNCSLPVIRVRRTDSVISEPVVPIDR